MPDILDELPLRRVVAVVGTDLDLARALAAATSGRALSLVDPRLSNASDAGAVWPYAGPAQVAANNAEVLLLTGRATAQVARLRRWRHARVVAWSTDSVPAAVVAGAGATLAVVTRRAHLVGRARIGRRAFWVLVNRRPARPRHSRFFSPILGVDGFLSALGDAGARYVVLRWFDRLPEIPPPNQDLDLLVADADLPVVDRVLESVPGVVPADVYTVSGLPGTDYRGGPYYPPPIAERLLAGRTLLHDRYAVPTPEDAFLALAFHVVYHKGETSGLARRAGEPPRIVITKHDYAAALISQAKVLGIPLEPTLTALDEMLAARGWRPPPDMLTRLTLPAWHLWLVRVRDFAQRRRWQLPTYRTRVGRARRGRRPRPLHLRRFHHHLGSSCHVRRRPGEAESRDREARLAPLSLS